MRIGFRVSGFACALDLGILTLHLQVGYRAFRAYGFGFL